jgi:hypothetical protein
MEKIFNQKNFNNFIWSPLGSRGNIYINFCLQVHFQVSAAWYCSNYLPPVSMTWWQIFRRCRWYRWQFATGVNNTRGTGGKICRRCLWYRWQICRRCHRCRWHWWWTLTCEYLREFSQKFEMIQRLLSGAWGKVIHEQNLKQKILWHCLFKYCSHAVG